MNEILTKKRFLEQAILHGVQDFEDKTGLSVRYIRMEHGQIIAPQGTTTLGIELEVRL